MKKENIYDDAIKEFTSCTRVDKKKEAFIFRARLYENKMLYQKAFDYYTKAIKLDSNDAMIYYYRGNLCYEYDRHRLAIKNYTKVLELVDKETIKKEYSDIYIKRGNCYRKRCDFTQALDDYNSSLELKRDIETYYNRAYVQTNLKDSIKDYAKVISMEKYYSNVREDKFGAYPLKSCVIERAYEIKKNDSESYYLRGVKFQDEEKYDEAIKDYTKALEICKNKKYYLNRGTTYLLEKNYDGAIKDYNNVLKIDPNNEKAYCNIGCVYMAIGNYQKAIINFSKAIEKKPLYKAAYINRGIVYYAIHQYQNVINDFLKAIDYGKSVSNNGE